MPVFNETADDRRDHSSRARHSAARRADRRRRLLDRRHTRASCSELQREIRVHAAAAGAQSGQGGRAAARVRLGHRRHRGRSRTPTSNIRRRNSRAVALISEGRADVVYGSRFLGRHRVFLFTHYLGNRVLTLLTNVLYNTMLTDMETCYKVMRRDVLERMTWSPTVSASNRKSPPRSSSAVTGSMKFPSPTTGGPTKRARNRLAGWRRRAVGPPEAPVYRLGASVRGDPEAASRHLLYFLFRPPRFRHRAVRS